MLFLVAQGFCNSVYMESDSLELRVYREKVEFKGEEYKLKMKFLGLYKKIPINFKQLPYLTGEQYNSMLAWKDGNRELISHCIKAKAEQISNFSGHDMSEQDCILAVQAYIQKTIPGYMNRHIGSGLHRKVECEYERALRDSKLYGNWVLKVLINKHKRLIKKHGGLDKLLIKLRKEDMANRWYR